MSERFFRSCVVDVIGSLSVLCCVYVGCVSDVGGFCSQCSVLYHF